MARPRKDPALKALRGTLRKDREPKAVAAAIAGPMIAPVPLTERALKHFDRIAALLARENRASAQFGDTVALLAQRLDQVEAYQQRIADHGSTYETVSQSGSVMYRIRPEVTLLSDALRHIQSLLSELMLSPTAAQRIARPDAPKSNPFASLEDD
jgi:P27 family predicted phage terminase small subunit